jgi:sphinganine-1-phosphate aldolase
MEAEIVAMALDIFNGDETCCGVMTSGGTESIIMIMFAYRNWARINKGIERPNLVHSYTAHAAFDKACQLCDIEVRKIDTLSNHKFNLKGIKNAIDENTIAVCKYTNLLGCCFCSIISSWSF